MIIALFLIGLSLAQKVTYTFPEFPYKETNKNVRSIHNIIVDAFLEDNLTKGSFHIKSSKG